MPSWAAALQHCTNLGQARASRQRRVRVTTCWPQRACPFRHLQTQSHPFSPCQCFSAPAPTHTQAPQVRPSPPSPPTPSPSSPHHWHPYHRGMRLGRRTWWHSTSRSCFLTHSCTYNHTHKKKTNKRCCSLPHSAPCDMVQPRARSMCLQPKQNTQQDTLAISF